MIGWTESRIRLEAHDELLAAVGDHSGLVSSVLRGLLTDPETVEDAIQDVWLAFLEQAYSDRIRNPRGWLVAVARNIAFSKIRGEVTRRRHEVGELTGRVSPVYLGEGVGASDGVGPRDRLSVAMHRLPGPFRKTIALRFWEGRPPRDIVACTGVPLGTVKSRLKRGIAMLRQALT